MKKVLSFLLTGVSLLTFSSAFIVGKASPSGMSGSGTAEDPYQIATKDDLWEFHDIIEGANGKTQNVGIHAYLTHDIDLEGSSEEMWEPIGHYSNTADQRVGFEGVLDGRGHEISGLYYSSTEIVSNIALFDCVQNGGTIKNLSVYGTFSVNKGSNVSGFVGTSYGEVNITDCHNYVIIDAGGYAAGIISSMMGDDEGDVVIDKCSNRAYIGGKQVIYGIAAYCYGPNSLTVSNCYNSGNITVSNADELFEGGGIGCNCSNAKYINCLNIGQITSKDSKHAGAISDSGEIGDRFSGCYYLVGKAPSGLYNTEDEEGKVQALTADQLMEEENFVDWDFFDTWKMGENCPIHSYESNISIGNVYINDEHSLTDNWSYDYWTNTLTLKDLEGSGSGTTSLTTGFRSYITSSGKRPLNLVLEGNSIIENTDNIGANMVCGISTYGDLIISGNGSLDTSAVGAQYGSWGIYSMGKLVVNSGVLSATGGTATNYSNSVGVQANGGYFFNGGTIILAGGEVENGQSVGLYYSSGGGFISENVKYLITTGKSKAISTEFTTELSGMGYTNREGTEGKEKISAGSYGAYDDQIKKYKYAYFAGITPEDVIELINDIGTVEYTTECKNRIDAARDAYDSLDVDSQELVTNYSTLTAAEDAYEAMRLDHEAAEAVEALIANLAPVTLEKEQDIINARTEYEALTATQKELVSNLDDLVSAESELNALKEAYAAAEAVDALINAIGEVTYPNSKKQIDNARTEYEKLNATAKGFVENLATLEAAEQALVDDRDAQINAVQDEINAIDEPTPANYEITKPKVDIAKAHYVALTDEQKELFDVTTKNLLDTLENQIASLTLAKNDAENAMNKINAIETVIYPNSKAKIDAARTAYDGLSATGLEFFNDDYLDILTAAESSYSNLREAAINNVIAIIDEIGEVEYNSDSKTKITKARTAYDRLEENDKNPTDVSNYNVLVSAEARYEELKKAGAIVVINLIKAIGKVEYTAASKVKIDTARTAYDALNEERKGLVENYNVLTNDEAIYQHVDYAVKKIEEIGTVTLDSGENIKIAKEAYNSLTDEEKALIPNYHDTLVEKSNTYDDKVHKHNTAIVLAIVFGIIGGIILLLCVAWILMLFVFNKWVKKNDKVLRACKLFGIKKNGKPVLLVSPFRFETREENEIFKTKEEALK